jgi:xanthine dehydrogenase large subunit
MKNVDSKSHVRGESIYLDDIPLVEGTLYACVYDSPVAHGVLKSVDISEAETSEGVVKIILPKDLIGENQIGGILPDEPLLADAEVHFQGMPVALVLAETEELARAAVKKIKSEIEPLEVVTDPRVAYEKNDLIVPPKHFKLGDTESAFKTCAHYFEGRADMNGQEHLYIDSDRAGRNARLFFDAGTDGGSALRFARDGLADASRRG